MVFGDDGHRRGRNHLPLDSLEDQVALLPLNCLLRLERASLFGGIYDLRPPLHDLARDLGGHD